MPTTTITMVSNKTRVGVQQVSWSKSFEVEFGTRIWHVGCMGKFFKASEAGAAKN